MKPASHGLAVALPDGMALPGAGVWTETLDVPRDHPAARRRRGRELSRTVPPATVRAVVIDCTDGADLVVVADRATLDRAGLDRFARALIAGHVQPVPAGEVTPTLRDPDRLLGLGDRRPPGRFGRIALPELSPAPDRASLIAGLALVISVYGGGEALPIGVIGDRGPVRVAQVEVRADDTVGTLTDRSAAVDPPSGQLPELGFVLTDSGPDTVYHAATEPVFPITLCWTNRPDGTLTGHVLFDRAHLAEDLAEPFVRYLGQVLGQLARLPASTPIAELTGMTPEDVAAVLDAGRTTTPAVPGSTIPAGFAELAKRHPDAPACSDGTTTVTYRELADAADRLAGALRTHGARPGVRVGVCLDRTVELVCVLLAVLDTGATYVPMDIRAPRDRLAFLVEDAEPVVVITDLADFPQGVSVLSPAELRAAGRPDAGGETAGPDDAAYVIYTSGSSGRPKGVVVPHRNVLALLAATAPDLRLGPDDVWSCYHSSAFDFSVWEIWGCLLTGGHLICVPYWTARAPEEFHRLLADRQVTVLSQTPSAFAQLQDTALAEPADLAVRLVVFGGEPLDVRTLRPWQQRYPHTRCRLVNMFGITETTVHVTSNTISPAEIATGSRSVGRPLPGWTVSIRDRSGRPLPFGAQGEIHVGGVGVAKGYLNRDELTARHFGSDESGQRVYRSGDRGRLHPDGHLDHLGRLDNQVQLRGYRIELDEIRAVLLDLPGVHAAAVVLHPGPPDTPGAARLDAYVALAEGSRDRGADIRRQAALILPDYMVPSTVTVVPALPLTVNGKVDVAALPAPDAVTDQHDERPEPTMADGTTAAMVRVWNTVFATEVGVDDDFFELGGNSLLAVRIGAAQRAAGLPPISPRDLYRNPTIAGLVAVLANAGGADDPSN